MAATSRSSMDLQRSGNSFPDDDNDNERVLEELEQAPEKQTEKQTDSQTDKHLVQTEHLLNEHFDTVFRYAYRLTGNSAAAEDVAQEVFLRAFRNLHQLRDANAARGWLLVITRNEFARWCKKFAPKTSLESLDTPDDQTAEEDCLAIDREEWVQRSLEQLPVDYRTVVVMFYFEQLSYIEIAQELGIPIGTVMSRLNRGKAHLKKTLRQASD